MTRGSSVLTPVQTRGTSTESQLITDMVVGIRHYTLDPQSYRPWTDAYEEIHALRSMGHKDADMTPVTVATERAAWAFLDALPKYMRAPEVAADPDGEINFEWYAGPFRVFSISISADNRLSYAGLLGPSRSVNGSDQFSGDIPSQLLEFISLIDDES